jgi:lysophospholipase L1-like esterase
MYQRYVAIGDSTVEGLDDPAPGGGYRGWADRLAEHLAAASPDLRYANLAVRGKRAGEVLAEQLPAAVALRPDLVAVAAGVNDVLRPGLDLTALAAELDALHGGLRGAGTTVITFTMPDPPARPLARLFRRRLDGLNDATRAAAARHGSVLVDLAARPETSHPLLWSADRLHASAAGHERIAAALAEALGAPGDHAGWHDPIAETARTGAAGLVATEVAWVGRHLLPWVARRVRGASSGDGLTAKRPALALVRPSDDRDRRP